MKTKYVVLISFVSVVLGFVLGRITINDKKSVETKEIVKYVPSTVTVTDTIFNPQPYNVFIPADTVYKYLTKFEKVDTAEILKDYYLTRQYSLDFSNDTLGVFKVNAEVGQNKLLKANSFVNPIIKTVYRENTVTQYKTKLLQPFLLVGTSPKFDVQQATIGIDLRQKYLIGVSGIRWDNKYNYTINLGIKF